MMTNSQIRSTARELLRYKWSTPVLTTLLLQCLGALCGGTGALIFLVHDPARYGFDVAMLRFVRSRGYDELRIESLFEAFNRDLYGKVVLTALLKMIFVFLWSLLLIVPGIVKAISYAMTSYIIADDPAIDCREALERSRAIMYGHKMRYFLLKLGYAALATLSLLLTLGIGLLWLNPYYAVVKAKFYEQVKADYESRTLKA